MKTFMAWMVIILISVGFIYGMSYLVDHADIKNYEYAEVAEWADIHPQEIGHMVEEFTLDDNRIQHWEYLELQRKCTHLCNYKYVKFAIEKGKQ